MVPGNTFRAISMFMDYYLLYKPYGMLSQFTQEVPGQRTLADLDYTFPPDVYPVGRLDADSEGLLLLTNDRSLNARLLAPEQKQAKVYWVQVEGIPTPEALEQLRTGVCIRIKGKEYKTLPALVHLQETPPTLPERHPPVRYRKMVPDSWLEITIEEGKNRQIRRMCAAAGYPVLRLVRVRFGDLDVRGLMPGVVRRVSREAILEAV